EKKCLLTTPSLLSSGTRLRHATSVYAARQSISFQIGFTLFLSTCHRRSEVMECLAGVVWRAQLRSRPHWAPPAILLSTRGLGLENAAYVFRAVGSGERREIPRCAGR